jgi:hypothetical protein
MRFSFICKCLTLTRLIKNMLHGNFRQVSPSHNRIPACCRTSYGYADVLETLFIHTF